MKLIKLLLTTAILLPLTAHAASAESRSYNFADGTYSLDAVSVPEVEKPKPRKQTAALKEPRMALPLPRKKWTVLLFLNGRNNLEMSMLFKVAALENIGSDANVNIIVEAGAIKPDPVIFGQSWNGARRFYIRKASGDMAGLSITASRVLRDKPNADMGDYRNLVEFINWSKANFPAEKYLISIANHGGAWLDSKKKTALSVEKGVSYDDVSGNYITTKELGTALRETGGADVLLFDDCLMQTIEVASEIKDSARFIIGSEEIARAGTFKYENFLPPLKKNPAMSAYELAMNMMQTIPADVRARMGKIPHTISALDASKLSGLNALVKDFAAAALDLETSDGPAYRAFRETMNEVTRYTYPFCADLYDFVNLAQKNVKEKIAEGKLPASEKTEVFYLAAESLKTYLTEQLVLSNFTQGSSKKGRGFSESRGISVYVPDITTNYTANGHSSFSTGISDNLETKYTDLVFDQSTGWSKLVNYLMNGHPKPPTSNAGMSTAGHGTVTFQ